jgi:hypothetical protein
MPLLLRQFLGGSAPDLPANEFKAYMLALAHIYEDEAPVSERTMARHLTARGWANAKAGLIAKGKLYPVSGGYMDRTALEVLSDYHQQQAKLSDGGRRAGLVSAAKRREAAKRQAAVGDLFANRLQSASTAEKANEFNAGGERTVGRARAHASKRVPNDLQTVCNTDANDMEPAWTGKNPNEFNGSVQRPVNQREEEGEEEAPLGSPIDEDDVELVEGEVEDADEFAVPPRRRPERSIPADWTPQAAHLSENVTNLIAEWPEEEFDREAVKFVEDAHAKDRRHRDWDRAFGVWLTRHDGYLNERRKRNERPSGWAETQ